MDTKNEFFRGFLFGIALLALVFGNPVFVIAADGTSAQDIISATHASFAIVPTTVPISSALYPDANAVQTYTVPPGACNLSTLSPMESKALMDLTHEGFSGTKLSSGDDNASGKVNEVKDLGKVELVGQSLDTNKAVKVTAPNYAAPANKFSFLNGLEFKGPFGIGFIIDDTLRVGRCAYSDPTACAINWQGEFIRTSGVGFQQDLVNAFQSVAATGKNLAQSALSTKDYNTLSKNYLTDINSKDFTTGTFGKGTQIKNSILTERYTAKNSTTCNNNACVISTYSAFDKYFNAWMTTDMVVFNIGPTLLHKANKLMSKFSRTTGGSISDLSGWQAKIAKLKEKVTGTPDYLMKTVGMPASTTIGQARISRFKTLVMEEGFEPLLQDLYIGKKLFSSGAGGAIGKLTAPESPIWKFTPEKRKKLFEAVEHLRAYARENVELIDVAKGSYAAEKAAADAITDPVAKQAALDAAKIKFGKSAALQLDDWDEILALDFEDWLKDKEELFSMTGTAVRKNGITLQGQGFVDLSSAPPFNLKRIVQKFRDDGSWSGWSSSADAETFKIGADGTSIQLYRPSPNKVIAQNVGIQDLKLHVAKMGQGTYSVQLPNGTYFPLNTDTVQYIESMPGVGANVSIFESSYAPSGVLTPLDFANRITDKRIIGRPTTALRNIDDLHNALTQSDYAGRRFMSVLDQQFATEGDMLKNYYMNPTMGIYKGTLLPIAYWYAKRGFGNEEFSAFMLPDTWSTLTVYQGVEKIYGDSFIDFFANEGSDQGDMFKRAFNSVPFVWNKVIELAASSNDFTKDTLSKYSGGFLGEGGPRDTVNDLAIYSHNENCAGCNGTFKYASNYLSLNGFRADNALQAYLLEANPVKDASTTKPGDQTGSVIISYTHHSNLNGKTGDIPGEAIDISNASLNKTTCKQKLEQYGLGWAGSAAGGVTAFAENAMYFVGFGPGLVASFTLQMTIGRDLQDCVDDVEGYYIHFYAPPTKEAAKTTSQQIISNDKVTSVLSDLGDKLNNFAKEKQGILSNTSSTQQGANIVKAKDVNTPIEKSLDKMKEQFDQFASQAKESNILQASIEMLPPSSGKLTAKDVFYVWFKDTMTPSAYRTEGKSITTDKNGNSIEEDYKNGTLKVNGKTILGPDKADHTRLITQDNRTPAKIVPKNLTKIGSPQSEAIVFEMNVYGEVKVLEPAVLDCIRRAVYDQTGIAYNGDELTQVFGNLNAINTQNYGSVFARGGRIFLEGSGPRYQGDSGARFIINGYWRSKLMIDSNQNIDAGQFIGMTFDNGTIVLNPQTNELIVWVRQHKDSILSNKDVQGLNAKLTSVTDPETECPVPALGLEAVSYLNDALGTAKVNNFNTSMNKLGPFTQLTTDKKIYEFYAKRDNNVGDCKTYFRVRDRNTGDILYDKEVIGGVSQNADGTLSFKTEDGQSHTLKVSAENGVPKLTYDNGVAETLVTAQGPNGSFWYDTNTVQWYPENGLQIPLSNAFKDNGAWFGTDKNGNVVGTPENKMTFNLGTQNGSGFNVPSMPETIAGIAAFIALFLMAGFMLTRGRYRRKL
ncbi:Uncharacterised protein [uncultured archaeon]|nr:Uncharacterised protein [uncultured archaeon]